MNFAAAVNEPSIRAHIVIERVSGPVLPVVVYHPDFDHAMWVAAQRVSITIQQLRESLECGSALRYVYRLVLRVPARERPASTTPKLQRCDLKEQSSMLPNGDS